MELTGFVGWRGMVGSVLMERMAAEGDFDLIEPVFFTTSDTGGKAPAHARNETRLQDANDLEALKRCEIDRHLPGRRVHQGRLPAAARRRLERLLDRRRQDAAHEGRRGDRPRPGQPATVIEAALARGVRNYIGGNCTVS